MKILPKIILILFFLAMALLSVSCSEKHAPEKILTVGIASMNYNGSRVVDGFKLGMEQRGYVENKNIKYIYPGPYYDKAKIKQLIEKFVAEEVDLVFTLTTPATKIASKILKGSQIPLIFGPIMSATKGGIVSSLYDPNNLATGVEVRGAAEKALFYLNEIIPLLKHIYVPVQKNSIPSEISFVDLQKAAKKIDINVIREDVISKEDLEHKLLHVPAEAEAVWVAPSSLIIRNIKLIVKTAMIKNLPVASPAGQVQNGPLITYSAKHSEIGKQISRLADKLLKGVKPGSIPIETAEFFLGLNVKTAKKIGVKIPEHLLNEADNIIY